MPAVMVCQRCRREKIVRNPSQARRQRFCSRQCAAAATGGFLTLRREDRARWAREGARTRRRQFLATLDGLSPVEIYRKAYSVGWHAGVRYMRKYAA